MSFATTLLAACAAAILSAQLAGGLLSGAYAGGPLSLLAPLPLLALGFFTLPLAALAAALIGAALVAITGTGLGGLAFLTLVGIPSFAASWLGLLRGSGSLFGNDGHLDPGAIGFLVAILLSLVTVLVQIVAEPSFAAFEAASRAIALQTADLFLAEMPDARGALSREMLADSLTAFGPVMTMAIIASVFFFLVYIAARIAKRWGRLARSWPDFAASRLPPGGLGVFGGAVLLVVFGGWMGLFGKFVMAGLIILFVLLGLAVLHYRARSNPGARWLVPAAWFSLIILGPFTAMAPVLLLAGLGLVDHLFDLRGLRRPANP